MCEIDREHLKNKQMILDSSKWLYRPLLPVKRTVKGFEELGVIWAVGKRSIVYIGNLFTLPNKVKEFANLSKYEYENVDQLLADGWVVD